MWNNLPSNVQNEGNVKQFRDVMYIDTSLMYTNQTKQPRDVILILDK